MAEVPWIRTEATVTACRYQSPGLGPLAFGFNWSGRQKFRISFEFSAQGRIYAGEFQSPTAVPQGERVSLTYSPLNPADNSLDSDLTPESQPPPSRIAIGILGSIVLSVVWLAVLRGCR